MDILSTREWAILIWVLLLAISYYNFSPEKEELKEPFKKLLRTLFARQIVSVFVLMSIYVGLMVYFLEQVGVWDSAQFKTTIIWYFSVASLSLFRLNHYEESPHRLSGLVADNFRLVSIIEYLVSTYTFHLAVEIMLVPVLFVLVMVVAIAEAKPELKAAHTVLNGLLDAIAVAIFCATLYLMFGDIGRIASSDGVMDFIVPSVLTALYVPFVAFMVVYSTYQNVLIKLRYSIKKRHLEFYARLAALLVFNFRIDLLKRWATNVALRKIETIRNINQSILQILQMAAREKKPPKVDRSEGWSPYEAKDYLTSEGIKTRHYHPVDPADATEWFCCSDLVEFGNGLISNNIAYYLNGDEHAVKSLKLKLNVNSPEHSLEAHAKLLSAADTLIKKALGLELYEMLDKTITPGTEGLMEGPGFKIALTKHFWPNQAFGGYDLGVELSGI